MSGDVLNFPATRELNIAPRDSGVKPSRVLADATGIQGEFQSLLLIGLLKDGSIYAADTQDHFGDTILLIERFKQAMMGGFDDQLKSDNPPGTPA